MHLAARQGAALAVQAQVADANVNQITQACGDFLEQQRQRLVVTHRRGHRAGHRSLLADPVEEPAQALDRQQHQVVQAQARHGFELGAGPAHPLRQEALRRVHHRVGVWRAADAPQQAFGLEARAPAGGARRVAAVLGQQHPDVHLVGLGLQVLEEALNAEPVLVPLAIPIRRAVDDPVALLLAQLVPRGVARNAGILRMAHQVVLALLPRRRLHRLDRTRAQRELVVRDHQAVVDADHATEAAAGVAGTHRRIERKRRRNRIGVAQIALRAMQPGGKFPDPLCHIAFGQRIDVDAPATPFERRLDRLDHANLLGVAQPEPVGHHIQHLAPERAIGASTGLGLGAFGGLGRRATGRLRRCNSAGNNLHLALGLHPGIAAHRQPLRDFLGRRVGRQFHRERDHQARVPLGGQLLQLGVNRLGRVVPHRQTGAAVEQLAGAREQQFQMVIEFGHRANGRPRRAHRIGLIDRDRRRHALHLVHRRFVHAVEELPRIGRKGLDITPLTFGVQGVEHQAGLARAARPGDDRELAGTDVQVEVLEIVLTCSADADVSLGHGGELSGRGQTF